MAALMFANRDNSNSLTSTELSGSKAQLSSPTIYDVMATAASNQVTALYLFSVGRGATVNILTICFHSEIAFTRK